MKKALMLTAVVALAATLVLAHPHLAKTVTAKLDGGIELKVSYFTAPANMEHVKNTENGAFKVAFARLSTSGDLMGGKIPAGEYTIGAFKDGDNKWTMALYPGQVGYGEAPDASKAIRLDSHLSKGGMAEHVHFDISPGSGDMEGKVTLIWHFGDLHLAGVIA